MTWQSYVVLFFLILSVCISLALTVFAWRQRRMVWAPSFALLTTSIALWSLAYGLELSALTLAGKTVWAQFQYIGIAFTPVGWFLFAMAYSGRSEWLENRRVAAVMFVPIFAIIMAFTNGAHFYFWSDYVLNTEGPFAIFDASYGPGWWLFFVFSYTLLLVGSIGLFLALRQVSTEHRWQLVVLLLSPLLPWLANLLYILRLSPIPQLDLAPFAFTLSALIMGFGILQFRLFTVLPVARTTVIDSMRTAVIVLDNQARVGDLNPAATRLLNVEAADAIGRHLTELVSDWPETLSNTKRTFRAREEVALSIEGQRRFFNLLVQPVYDRSRIVLGRIVTLDDITADKQASEALAMTKVKSELLAKVGHELRTPLNGILGLSEMLEFGAYGPVNEEQGEILRRIVERCQYLTNMVNDLLQQTRLEQGGFALNKCEFAVADLVAKLEESVNLAVEDKGLTLSIDVDPGVPRIVYGDPTRLYQVLLNLVDNAIKFTIDGSINVRLYRSVPGCWSLEVTDTGVGIAPQSQSRIFEPFQQGNYSVTRSEDGVGLGLAIVHQLTQLMGGEVILKSQEGQGTTFTVTLPLEPMMEVAA